MITIRNYTNEELKYICDNYSNMSIKQIAIKLNKTENSISNAVRKLGLKKQIHNKWTDEEISFLKSNYINMTSEEIAIYINHSVDSINTMRGKLHLIRNTVWSDEEIKFLRDNFESMLFVEIAKKLDRTESAVRAKCFDLKLFKNTPWSEEELDFVKNNYREMKTSEIAQKLSRTMSSIELKASRMGLKKYPYTCDYHYFDVIDTEEKAYWLGFLSADGWININNKTNSGVTGIELQYSDINHLKKFNKSISGNYKITDRWRTCSLSKNKNKKNHMCVIRIFSINMYKSLKKIGFDNNKSYDFNIPNLRNDLIRHYMRGYFDGDGCFTYTDKSFKVGFITASKILNNDILSILEKQNVKFYEYSYINEYGTIMYAPGISRYNDKIKFLDWIYSDCNIYLDRKYTKYLKVKNEHFTQYGLAI